MNERKIAGKVIIMYEHFIKKLKKMTRNVVHEALSNLASCFNLIKRKISVSNENIGIKDFSNNWNTLNKITFMLFFNFKPQMAILYTIFQFKF